MSTKANIVVKSGREKLIFYKHSDGYPSHTMPILNEFLEMVKAGEIRDNVSQSAGWLIELGRQSMLEENKKFNEEFGDGVMNHYSWKVGSIEPTTCIHNDIEYLYTIDLNKKKITVKGV